MTVFENNLEMVPKLNTLQSYSFEKNVQHEFLLVREY